MKELTRRLARPLTAVALGLAVVSTSAIAQQAEEGQERQAEARQEPAPEERVIQVKILGMSCPFCAYGVEQKLKKLEGVEGLEVQLQTGLATLTMAEGADIPNEELRKVVDQAGFEAAAIVRSFDSDHEDWNPEEIP